MLYKYFHYADEFRLKQKGETVKLFGYKKVKNRRSLDNPNERLSNIVKSSLEDYIEGILYLIKDNEFYSDKNYVENIQVNVTKQDGTVVNAFTFRAKPKWTFNNDREKTDVDTNLTGQLLGADKGVQGMRARLSSKMESKKLLKFNDFCSFKKQNSNNV